MQRTVCPSVRAFTIAVVTLLLVFVVRPLSAAQGGTIHGSVRDPDRRPVAGAAIVVEGHQPAPVLVHTDAGGTFDVPVPAPGRYRLRASAPGLAAPPHEVEVAAGAAVDVDLTLRLAAVDERVVVTAAQVDTPLAAVPDSTTVLGGDVIDTRQQFSIGQALRSVPGLTVQQSGGPGTLTSLFLRGGESDFTLVLVDGVRANAFGGGLDLSQVPLADVDRIEVVRGPQSALYGADAIGGVVHVITRSGGPPSARGLAEAGSRGMQRLAASTTGEGRSLRWQAGADRFAEDGFTGPASNGTRVTNDDARAVQGAVTLGWRARGTDVQGTFRYVDTDRGTPGPFGSDPAGRFGGVDRAARTLTTRRFGGMRWIQPWRGGAVRQRTEVDAADYDLISRSRFPSRGESRRVHVRTQTDVAAAAAFGATAGLEWLGERGGSTFITAGGAPAAVERRVLGVFGEGRWSAGARLTVTAGVRAEHIRRAAFPGEPGAFTPRPDFPANTVGSVNPKVSAGWLLLGHPAASRAWTRLHGAAGTGIRPPDAFEIAFTDNPGLRPERSRSAELGIGQVLAAGAVQLDATAFINAYDDLIISVGRSFSGVSRWRTDNISNARASGVEASASWRPAVAWSLHAAYTWLDTTILAVDGSALAPAPYAVGDRLLRRPRHQASVDLAWTGPRVSAFAQWQARGATLDAEPAFGPTGGLYENPGYAVGHLGAALRMARGITLHARVLNVLNAQYEEVLGFPAPGRTAYIGVRLAAGR